MMDIEFKRNSIISNMCNCKRFVKSAVSLIWFHRARITRLSHEFVFKRVVVGCRVEFIFWVDPLEWDVFFVFTLICIIVIDNIVSRGRVSTNEKIWYILVQFASVVLPNWIVSWYAWNTSLIKRHFFPRRECSHGCLV